MSHLSVELLKSYVSHLLCDTENEHVETHLRNCRRCQQLWKSLRNEQESNTEEVFSIGDEIHGFQIVSHLGEGSFATVYQAWDANAERKVAIKVFRDESDFQAILPEARILAKLDMTSTINLIDVRESPNCIIQQLADGGSLDDWIRDNEERSIGDVIDLCTKIAESVAVLHKANVIHRDLKPSNILLTATGDVLLSDFGVSVDLNAPKELDDANCGSIPFMSPERLIHFEEANQPHADLYSLGVIFYELLVGKRPFSVDPRATDRTNKLRQKIIDPNSKPIVPSALRNEIPESLSKLCLQLLDKNKEERPKNAARVARKLQRIRFLHRNKKKLVGAIVLVTCLTPVLYWVIGSSSPSPELLDLKFQVNAAVKDFQARVGDTDSEKVRKDLSVANELIDAGDYSSAKTALEQLLVATQRAALEEDIQDTQAKIDSFFELGGGREKTLQEYPHLKADFATQAANVPESYQERKAYLARMVSYLSKVEETFNARARHAAYVLGFCASFCQSKDDYREYPYELKDSDGNPYKYRSNTFEYDRVLKVLTTNGIEQMQRLGVSTVYIAELREALRPDYVSGATVRKFMFDNVLDEVEEKWNQSVAEAMSLGWNVTIGCTMELYDSRESSLLYIKESDQLGNVEMTDSLRAKLQEFIDRSHESNAMEIKTVTTEYVEFVTDLSEDDFRSTNIVE